MQECTNCTGEGGWYNIDEDWVLCEDCNGSGHIIEDDVTSNRCLYSVV